MTAKQEADRRFYLKHRERKLEYMVQRRKVLKLREQVILAREECESLNQKMK